MLTNIGVLKTILERETMFCFKAIGEGKVRLLLHLGGVGGVFEDLKLLFFLQGNNSLRNRAKVRHS